MEGIGRDVSQCLWRETIDIINVYSMQQLSIARVYIELSEEEGEIIVYSSVKFISPEVQDGE